MAEDTLARLFWRRVEGSAARPAQLVRWQGRWHALTWGQVGRVVRELAVGLLALGVKPGEAVAFLARSRAEWVQADFAIMSAGAVTVPIYPTYMPEQIAYQVEDADAKVLIVEDAAQLAKWVAVPIRWR